VDDAPVVDQGLDAGFEAFYRDHHGPAVRWATALVGRSDVAADLAHDALIRVGGRLAEVDEPTPYLRRSVVNACHDWHRRADRETGWLAHHDVVARPHPATIEVLDVLARLPYRQRAAVVLRFWDDWPSADIAAALGCREVTVRVLVHRGLAALRHQLTPEEGS